MPRRKAAQAERSWRLVGFCQEEVLGFDWQTGTALPEDGCGKPVLVSCPRFPVGAGLAAQPHRGGSWPGGLRTTAVNSELSQDAS